MAVPKLNLQGAGLGDDSLRLIRIRHERTQDWLQQNCTAQSDSLDDTTTVFSMASETVAPLKSSRSGRRVAKGVCSDVQGLRRDGTWQEAQGQVQLSFVVIRDVTDQGR